MIMIKKMHQHIE